MLYSSDISGYYPIPGETGAAIYLFISLMFFLSVFFSVPLGALYAVQKNIRRFRPVLKKKFIIAVAAITAVCVVFSVFVNFYYRIHPFRAVIPFTWIAGGILSVLNYQLAAETMFMIRMKKNVRSKLYEEGNAPLIDPSKKIGLTLIIIFILSAALFLAAAAATFIPILSSYSKYVFRYTFEEIYPGEILQVSTAVIFIIIHILTNRQNIIDKTNTYIVLWKNK
jgi:hypothetical protein